MMRKNAVRLFLWGVLLVLAGCDQTKNPRVLIETEKGSMEVELYDDRAPVTVENFLKYVDEGRYENATFYRTVRPDNQPGNKIKIDVIQGGLFEDNHPLALPPIRHETTKETGIRHLNGTISMARNEPGTASSEFFICIGDQPSLDYGGKRNPDGQGFAAFGRVVNGMDVVKKIWQSPAEGQWLKPRVKILGIKRK